MMNPYSIRITPLLQSVIHDNQWPFKTNQVRYGVRLMMHPLPIIIPSSLYRPILVDPTHLYHHSNRGTDESWRHKRSVYGYLFSFFQFPYLPHNKILNRYWSYVFWSLNCASWIHFGYFISQHLHCNAHLKLKLFELHNLHNLYEIV